MADNNGIVIEEMEFSEAPSIPAGVHPAVFERAEEVEHEKYGRRWRWIFTVEGGGADGRDVTISKWTSPYLSRKSKANEIVTALRGRAAERGERVRPADLAGIPCTLVVRYDEALDVTKIESVAPAPRRRSAPQAATVMDPASLVARMSQSDRARLIAEIEASTRDHPAPDGPHPGKATAPLPEPLSDEPDTEFIEA